MRFSIALICVAALAAIVPQAAVACAPAVCQYVEQPPSANGHNPSHGHHSNGPSPLSQQTQKQLNSSAAGRATAAVAGATAPKSQGKKDENSKGKSANGRKDKGKNGKQATIKRRNLPSQSTGGSSGGGSDSGGGGGGIGIVLPVILGLSLLGAIGYAMWRRGAFRNFDLASVFNRRGNVGG